MSGLEDLSDAELMKRYELSQKPAGQAPAEPSSALGDFAKSAGIGLVKGGIGLMGLPGDIGNLWNKGTDAATNWIAKQIGMPPEQVAEMRQAIELGRGNSAMRDLPTSGGIRKSLENNITGPLYEPQTTPGRYAQAVTEMAPGAVAGGGGLARSLFNYGLVPGLASEGAGDLPGVKGSAAEPWVKGATALVTGGVAGAVNRPNTVARVVGEATQGVTQAQVAQAEQLFAQAQQLGTPITRAEALQRITNGGTGLGDVQRVVEGSGALKPFMAERPGQVQAAGNQMLDTIAPPTNPFMVGPQASAAATETIDGIRGAINNATRPSYDAARQSLVPQNIHAAMMQDRLFATTLNRLRTDPELMGPYSGLSDRSSIVYDGVKKYLEQRGQNLRSPTNPEASHEAAGNVGGMAGRARDIAVEADRTAMGLQPGQGTGNLERALADQATLRQNILEPRQHGPLGQLANAKTTEGAIEAVFPRNPLGGSAGSVGEAIQAVAARNPRAARDLVAAHVESTFTQATRDLQAGANQWGGAGFAAALRGNAQQAANLEAAIRALPNGDQTWQGIDRFLTVMEAQGMRQRPGSATAFNQEMQSELRKGGPIGEAVTLAAGGGLRLPARAAEAFQRWQLGNNVDQLARLFTDPQAGRMFRDLVGATGTRAEAIIGRISLLGANQATAQERK